MENRNPQKGKLLKLLELLRQETDEKNPMSTAELCVRLSESGINCDRRTLSKDIDLLNELGYEVMSTRKQHLKCYYIEDRSFSDAEIRILIDAVQAASFITERKSEELIQKLCETGGCHRAKILRENLVCFNTQKHTNESVYISVDTLERALQEKRQASFLYFDLDENGERAYRREKERYVVDPMALVFENDNYYLMTYSKKHGEIANYRVDRMSAVEVEQTSVCEDAIIKAASIAEYTEQVFSMYGGKPTDMVLEYDEDLAGVIYDKFGENTKMMRIGDNTLLASLRVQISPTFWGWLFQFTGRMRIVSPKQLAEQYAERAEQIIRAKKE